MWLSFSGNFLIFLIGVFIFIKLNAIRKSDFYQYFFLFTGVSSLIAGFGHLPLLEHYIAQWVLLFSRIISLFSLYFFTKGTAALWGHKWKLYKIEFWNFLLVFCLSYLAINNVFLPVMIFGILGMGTYSLFLYLKLYFIQKSASSFMLIGIILTVLSAISFALNATFPNFNNADLSHILISIGLLFMYKNVKLNYENNVSIYPVFIPK